MRIIPKKTKVELELFKGIGVLDVIIGSVGLALMISLVLSDLPWRIGIAVVVFVIFAGLIIPIEDEKGYMMIYHLIIYLARHKEFKKNDKKNEEPTVKVEQKQDL